VNGGLFERGARGRMITGMRQSLGWATPRARRTYQNFMRRSTSENGEG